MRSRFGWGISMVGKDLIDKLLGRYDSAKTSRSKYENTLHQLGKYCWPKMQDIVHTEKDDDGQTIRTVDIYDTTAITASKRETTGIIANLMPVGVKMFEFAAEDQQMNEDSRTKEDLSRATSAVHKVLWRSNFIGQVTNLVRSMVVFTLGAISMDRVKGRWVFKFYHIKDIFFEKDHIGDIDTVFRRFFYTARQARQAYKGDLGPTIEADLKDEGTKRSNHHEFVHIVYPNEDYDAKIGSKKFASLVINVKDKIVVQEGGLSSMKYKIVMFGENDDGDMGDGPSTDILPEVKMVNAMRKTLIVAAQKNSDPSMIVEDDGVVGQPDTSGGGLIVVRAGAEFPRPWISGARLEVNDAMVESSRQDIREAFLNDVFDAMKFHRRETKAELKEAEILARVEEGFMVLAPLVAAIQRDLLDPMILEILDKLSEEELGGANISEIETKIVYQGRLALAMSSMETNAIETVIAKWGPIDEVYQVFDNLDMDDSFKTSALNTGVPAALIRDWDDVLEMRADRNAPAAAAAEAQVAVDASTALKNVAQI